MKTKKRDDSNTRGNASNPRGNADRLEILVRRGKVRMERTEKKREKKGKKRESDLQSLTHEKKPETTFTRKDPRRKRPPTTRQTN